MDSVLFSSQTSEWLTPKNFLEKFVYPVTRIDLDPCSSRTKNVIARNHFTAEDDGLSKEWAGAVYLNPPYGKDIEKWTDKLITSTGAKVHTSMCLLPARTDTKWFHNLVTKSQGLKRICFLRGRLKFTRLNQYGQEVELSSATFPSVLICISSNSDTIEQFELVTDCAGITLKA
jgi:site-specific DNA-methyltransferase (adenine-specific)